MLAMALNYRTHLDGTQRAECFDFYPISENDVTCVTKVLLQIQERLVLLNGNSFVQKPPNLHVSIQGAVEYEGFAKP